VVSSREILAISAVRSSPPIEALKARNVVPTMMMDDKEILSWRFEEDMADMSGTPARRSSRSSTPAYGVRLYPDRLLTCLSPVQEAGTVFTIVQLVSRSQCPAEAFADGPYQHTIAMTEPALQYTENQQPTPSNHDNSALRRLCAQLHSQVTAFLEEDVKTERLKSAQAQTRRSLAVIQEALDRYE